MCTSEVKSDDRQILDASQKSCQRLRTLENVGVTTDAGPGTPLIARMPQARSPLWAAGALLQKQPDYGFR